MIKNSIFKIIMFIIHNKFNKKTKIQKVKLDYYKLLWKNPKKKLKIH